MSDDSDEPARESGSWGWPSRTGSPTPAPRSGPRRLLPSWRTLLATVLVAATVVVGGLVAGYLLIEIPEPKAAAAAQNNVYLYADGTQIARVGEVNREKIPLSEVPTDVQHAVLAAEDRDFWGYSAVDVKAMARAGWNMLRGAGKQSGSTITQQYVKNYYLDQRQTVDRKIREFFIAIKLDREVSKEEILEGYLNTSYFGRNSYGIQAAAHAYYGKDAADLDVSEGAYLAAVLNAPSAFDPQARPDNRERVIARWQYVLRGMVSQGWLDPGELESLTFPEPDATAPHNWLAGQRGYLIEAVNEHLVETGVLDEKQLAAGGFKITTTIEPDLQEALAEAVREELLEHLDEDNERDAYVRAGGASVETGTGRVLAMYGGTDFTEQFVNNATRRDYQAASTFKPFVYAAALEHGATDAEGNRIGPDTEYDGTSGREVVARDGRPTGWSPGNEGDKDHGDIKVSTAMDKSVNAVFAQMGQDIGPERVRGTAVALGIPPGTPGLDDAASSISLGTATPSPLDMAGAYATLANHGVRHPLVLVESVTEGGREIDLPRREPERAISREAADGTTAVLLNVVRGGTGTAAQAAGRPAAGKTGTAEHNRAAWFAGYTPELATVIAVVGQDPETGGQESLYRMAGLSSISGGSYPARIWAHYTATALAGAPAEEFDLVVPERYRPSPDDGRDDGEESGPDEENDVELRAGRSPSPSGGPPTGD
ncbi:transglycosylase domain-containing protein [Streptomyces sodiiphilus]|uniref:Transglycosylase domain-containing protein n=1 Tax=Streptomyces sodiiphilus TaxID=226217 RepID=A0ABN2PU96_9ACTN